MSKMTRSLIGIMVVFASTMAGAQQWGAGWKIPVGAEKETSPVQPTAAVLAEGKTLFDANCARCHGETGVGDGPESNPRLPAADLTDPFRVDLNPDGVIFHRVWGGKPPAMPAFADTLTREQVWTIVHYAKSLRKPA
jgi:mono/diheme cytochrome c family protein